MRRAMLAGLLMLAAGCRADAPAEAKAPRPPRSGEVVVLWPRDGGDRTAVLFVDGDRFENLPISTRLELVDDWDGPRDQLRAKVLEGPNAGQVVKAWRDDLRPAR